MTWPEIEEELKIESHKKGEKSVKVKLQNK